MTTDGETGTGPGGPPDSTVSPRRFRLRWWLLSALGVPVVAAWLWLSPQTFHIPSGSMAPTLEVGDRVFATMSYLRHQVPQRGDVVILRSPDNPAVHQVSRVLALGGETIEIVDKKVRIDGELLDDPWAMHRDPKTYRNFQTLPPPLIRRDQLPPSRVPKGSVFVLSDNRDNAYDSRFQGPVPLDHLVGRPLIIYYSESSERIGRRVE